MSEYLSKKAVLEYTKQNAAIFFDLESYHDFRNAVLSGAFDADDSEVQRLRVVLEKVVNRLEWWVKKFGCADVPGILFSRVSANEAIREAREALSTTIEPTGPYTVRRYVAAGINTKGQPEQHLMWKIKSLLENWDFRAIASELESEYDQGILLELVELCEMLTGAKSPRVNWLDQKDANVEKVERFECPCCGCEISAREKVGTEEWRHKYFGAEWPKAEGDGNDA